MRIYFVPRRVLKLSALVFLLVCSFLTASIVYFNEAGVPATAGSPIYQGNTGKKVVALTVNVDWGEEFIPAMLKEFKKNDAKVTFFVTGKWAEKHLELLKEMSKAGHSIQNHGYKHVHFNQLSKEQTQAQIKQTEDIIYKATGKRSSYFASPYGEFDRQLVKNVTDMDYEFIMWSADTIDWQRPAPETIMQRVLKRVHNDAIVLMHPTDPTLKALPGMLAGLKKEGYRMITIDEMITNAGKDNTNHDHGSKTE
ncbi:MAG: polysaccharide deacetylase family protein [Syntrophomonadaceae bacterium]|nr:polysaccharide deacetylase family protein [Syntrophomonadaceae bacterium]